MRKEDAMSENEKLELARVYIEKLANGIDPLTDREVRETDVINDVKISRCLFYVADILKQVSEQGGISAKKAKKKPFELSHEERQKFRYSESPIPITEITKRINELIDTDRMTKCCYKHISNWLIELGFLNVITTAEGKTFRRPTSAGEDIGISTEQRNGERGPYTVTLYSKSAQQFIIDNLDAVIELSRRTKEKSSDASLQGQPWTPVQDEILTDLFRKKVSTKEIAVTLKRTTGGIKGRLKRLGLVEQSGEGVS